MQSTLVILILVCVAGTFGYDYPKDKLYRAGLGFNGKKPVVIDGVRDYRQIDIGTGPNSFLSGVYRGPSNIGTGPNSFLSGVYRGPSNIGTGPHSFVRSGVYRGPSNFIGNPGYLNEFSNIPSGNLFNDFGDIYGYGIDRSYVPYGFHGPYGRIGGFDNFRFNVGVFGGKKPILGKYKKY